VFDVEKFTSRILALNDFIPRLAGPRRAAMRTIDPLPAAKQAGQEIQ